MGYRGFQKGFALGLVAGIAGSLFAYSRRHELRAKFWRLKAEAEVHHRVKRLRKMTRSTYDDIIDEVMKRYRTLGVVAEYEIDRFADELRRRYHDIKERVEEHEGEEEE